MGCSLGEGDVLEESIGELDIRTVERLAALEVSAQTEEENMDVLEASLGGRGFETCSAIHCRIVVVGAFRKSELLVLLLELAGQLLAVDVFEYLPETDPTTYGGVLVFGDKDIFECEVEVSQVVWLGEFFLDRIEDRILDFIIDQRLVSSQRDCKIPYEVLSCLVDGHSPDFWRVTIGGEARSHGNADSVVLEKVDRVDVLRKLELGLRRLGHGRSGLGDLLDL